MNQVPQMDKEIAEPQTKKRCLSLLLARKEKQSDSRFASVRDEMLDSLDNYSVPKNYINGQCGI